MVAVACAVVPTALHLCGTAYMVARGCMLVGVSECPKSALKLVCLLLVPLVFGLVLSACAALHLAQVADLWSHRICTGAFSY